MFVFTLQTICSQESSISIWAVFLRDRITECESWRLYRIQSRY